MVGSIKNRIAAFENLAEKSKSTSKLLAIVPPQPGFSASKKIAKQVLAKETYGHVPFKPLNSKSSSNIHNTNNHGNSAGDSSVKSNSDADSNANPNIVSNGTSIMIGSGAGAGAGTKAKSYMQNRYHQNETSNSDLGALEQYKNDIQGRKESHSQSQSPPVQEDRQTEKSNDSENKEPPQSEVQQAKADPVGSISNDNKVINTEFTVDAEEEEQQPSSMSREPMKESEVSVRTEMSSPNPASPSSIPSSYQSSTSDVAAPIPVLQQTQVSTSASQPQHSVHHLDENHNDPPFAQETQTNVAKEPAIYATNMYAMSDESAVAAEIMKPHSQPEQDDPPQNHDIFQNHNNQLLGMRPRSAEYNNKAAVNEPVYYEEDFGDDDDDDDDDGHHRSSFPIISVKSKDSSRSRNEDEPQGRDEDSISPLSFQGYKISSTSKRDQAPAYGENDVMDTVEEYYGDESSSQEMLIDTSEEEDDEEDNFVPTHNTSSKIKRMNLPDIDLEEDEMEEEESADYIDEAKDHVSKDESDDLISFGTRQSEANNNDDDDDSFGATHQKTQNGSATGLPTVEEEYDNFTLGSGESGDFFITKDVQANEPWRENFEESVKKELALNSQSSGYTHRTEIQELNEAKEKQAVSSRDPLFLDDCSSDSNPSQKSENSFEKYVNNMQPIRSVDDQDVQQNQSETVQDLMKDEELHAENLRNIDNHPLSEERNNMSLYDEDKVVLSDQDMRVLGINNDAPVVKENGILQDEQKQQVMNTNESVNALLENDHNYADDTAHNSIPFDETANKHRNESNEKRTIEQQKLVPLENHSDEKSSVYYPEEDFAEDDYEDCYDEETVDDETGDLLGIAFDELSMASEGQNSHFINQGNNVLYPAEYFIDDTDKESVPVNYNADSSKQAVTKEESQEPKSPRTNRQAQQAQQPYIPLPAVHEEEPINFVKPKEQKAEYPSGPLLTIRNDSNLSSTDEVSQMTESTYDLEQRLHILRSNQAKQEEQARQDQSLREQSRPDHSLAASKSDRSSLMTYSIAENSGSDSIVQSKHDVPIFREKNSLRDNPKLTRRDSTVSELTGSSGYGQHSNTNQNRRNSIEHNASSLSTISGQVSTNSKNERKKKPARRRSPSPSFRQGSFSTAGGRGRDRIPQKKTSSKEEAGKRPDYNKSNRKFSWRSLSPFRRRSSRRNKINESNSSMFDQYNQDQVRSSTSMKVEPPRLKKNSSIGSTPSEILDEDEIKQTSIPLVAVTLSDDSSKKKKKKKRFSLRSLSPFRGRSKRKSKKAGRADPFDEGETSI